jgi:acyl transferase domain-containing protein/NAD(P)-dependent dehydrogenase (short-subunit alcohol dehydrogenase family)/acyl carrier protein
MDMSNRAIAIVGLGAILPDAPSARAFWENILARRYSISETPPERWLLSDYYDPDPSVPDKTYSKIGGWVRGFKFDWQRFRIPPRVAAAMDEGQQWAVTIAAEALADYGFPDRPLNTENTGVILGTAMGGELHYLTNQRVIFPEYARYLSNTPAFQALPPDVRAAILAQFHAEMDRTLPPVTEDSMPGELPNIVAGRVANVLNLRGPNFITDAACASTFAAVAAAVEMLSEGHVDAVITGGVDRNMGPSTFVKFCKIGALSATGTRPFGDGADGFVMGEGAAAFLLKRLADAERDGDTIYAVIRGVGASSDGKGKGITAPNPVGQVYAVERAWRNAGLDPATATLVEAHGTSTRVGDVTEVESLAKVFGGAERGRIGLGSAKSNIGHLKAGAGAAGLLKTVFAIHEKILPPTLNCERPNPNIDFNATPFYLLHEAREWERPGNVPRRAGVSAYGFGGTNFHVVLEEYIPGMIRTEPQRYQGVEVPNPAGSSSGHYTAPAKVAHKPPLRGILALGADTPAELSARLDEVMRKVQEGWTPPVAAPDPADLRKAERLVIDFADHADLLDKLTKARKAANLNAPAAWKPLAAQGVFRGSGKVPGKVAFLFPGQGSQYLNMGRELAKVSPAVAAVFAEADRVMTPILGRPLTDYLFLDSDDPQRIKEAERALMQTAITQPAMLTLDIAILTLLAEYGIKPDMVMGHSLGEYGALVAAGIMPFAEALEAAAARGAEMTRVSVEDNGWMAAVMAPLDVIQSTLQEVDGYVIPANLNSYSQAVIGGNSKAVEQAIGVFTAKGYQAQRIPVSHAFHTRIVAPASKPLRKVLDRLHIAPPKLPLVANVTGELYPTTVEAIKDILEQQIASPVQWVKGLETLYREGCRIFVECGPKKALKGFVDDVLGSKPDVVSLFTNHPKTGEIASFNQALCGLYAAGLGAEPAHEEQPQPEAAAPVRPHLPAVNGEAAQASSVEDTMVTHKNGNDASGPGAASLNDLGQLLAQALQQASARPVARPGQPEVFDRNEPPAGSVVISGTGLGLPGAEKPVMAEDNVERILRGEQFVDLIPERFRRKMVRKGVTRVVKGEDGGGSFQTIDNPDDVIRLAGRPGPFDLSAEYGVPAKLVEALDITSQLAIAAGLDALREAGIPLVQTYRKTSKGTFLPERWMLPEALRDETGVIFASAFPGYDQLAGEMERYYEHENRLNLLEELESLRNQARDEETLTALTRRIAALREEIAANPYQFDRRFLFRILAMGHSQFAEYIGARGPNTAVNAACASTAQGVAIAEDWIRSGRCRRVLVVGADDVTSDHLMEWIGAGFLATGAAATDDKVEEAALPFDRRRHGTLLGMGACALVVESEDAVRERGMRGIVELLSSETRNSAFHGTRLDVDHISEVLESLITSAERRFGLDRYAMAAQTVFVSHETYTPARGGSASAEVAALRRVFGPAASEVVVANTKGFTGHPMGVGVEDVIAVKILEHGIVPPVPNYREVDPELGTLNLSRGGRYPVRYAIHFAAGFGSQIAITLLRRVPGGPNRIDNRARYDYWLAQVSGYDRPETEVVQRVLRVKAEGAPTRVPAPSMWQPGTGPTMRAAAPAEGGPRVVDDGRRAELPARPAYTEPPRPAPAPVQSNGKVAPAPVAPASAPVAAAPAPAPVAAAPTPAPVAPAPAPVAAATVVAAPAPAPAPAAPPRVVDPVAEKVLAIVAEKTGYPSEMLDLDLDLEADLGVDTVKQAETFAAVREAFGIPRIDDLKLRDYPTMRHVIGFVREHRPDLAAAPVAAPAPVAASAPAAPAPAAAPAAVSDPVAEKVLAIVADKTGYPPEMLDLDLDLEADLGVDTVKQAETFAAVREAFDIPRIEDLKLRDYPTLRHVIGFVRAHRPDLAAPAPVAPAPAPVPEAAPAPAATDPITEKVLAIVADKTGYPTEMLDLDLDLEADLGVDTVKQAETFAAVREAFGIPRIEDLKLRDYPTLRHVIGFVREHRPDLAAGGAVGAAAVAEAPASAASAETVASSEPVIYDVSEADRAPRRVPTPVLRPPLELCKVTGVNLEGSRVVVMFDRGGVGRSLASRLEKRGAQVLGIEAPPADEEIDGLIQGFLSDGPIAGIYWLTALDAEPDLEELDLEQWRELNRVRVKNLYRAVRALVVAQPDANPFLVVATRMGGLHGYDEHGATAPLGGAVTGFAKAYKRERPAAVVKAVDFEASRKSAEPAEALIAETLFDPGVVEVGYHDSLRFGIGFEERPAADGQPGMHLGPETVYLVTGAAGGITSAIVADLARAGGGGQFFLLDLTPAPDPADERIALFRQGRDALKAALIAEAQAKGEKVTPVQIDRTIMGVERSEAALRAIETVEAAGGAAFYRSLDLRDGPAVSAVVEEIRERFGRIDVLLHAGGIEISRGLADKQPDEFYRVFDIKADGFFSLLRAAKGMPIGATVAFSSVAGRFGNSGQTDYSAANDLLCKVTSSLRHTRPETRGIAIDWTAWGGIGMATRGSIPRIMEMAGIDMLPPEVGIPTIRRELTAGGTRGEIVVGLRLGILTEEFDEHGGIDPEKVAAVLASRERPFLMVGAVRKAGIYSGIVVETALDPAVQPFLYDHKIDGTPVLPGVMGTEGFAELASLLAPGYRVARIEHERLDSPVKFHRSQPRTLVLKATVHPAGEGELLAHTELRSVFQPAVAPGHTPPPPQETVHFRATVRLTSAPPAEAHAEQPHMAEDARVVERSDIYQVYFHGPAYQVLEKVLIAGNMAFGMLASDLPPDSAPAEAEHLVDPRLLELCFQTAGVWEIANTEAMALPSSLETLEVYRHPDVGNGKAIYAIVTAQDEGASFDARVIDEEGNVYLDLTGYRTSKLPGVAKF